MFVDTAKVIVMAGKGGDGAVSFRHEIYVDKGGPDGGDGGRGGDVVFVATDNLNTLIDFKYKPELKAKNGENGAKRNKRGKSGADLVVKVPVGTLIKRNDEIVADLSFNGQREIIAIGGDGGFGNAHFKSSTRQTPRLAENGEAGETYEAELELKLLADVGLLGLPNAGKSTFLSVVSNATPEIADYAFTTITPNLGVADVDGTLVSETGDFTGLNELRTLLQERGTRFVFGIATGRSLKSVEALFAKHDLPVPDVALCDVGTQIYYGFREGDSDKAWTDHIDYRWSSDAIRQARWWFDDYGIEWKG